MKCIQHIISKQISRVSDEEAYSKIEGDKLQPPMFRYVPKSEWKAQNKSQTTES